MRILIPLDGLSLQIWVDCLAAPRDRPISALLTEGDLYSCASYVSLLSLAAPRLVSGILHVSPRPRSGQVALALQT